MPGQSIATNASLANMVAKKHRVRCRVKLAKYRMIDTSTCADRLKILAAIPEHAAISGELLHAAAELDGYHALLGLTQTLEGWANSMGYRNMGPCHGCGQDILVPPPPLPPLFDTRWEKVPGDYETLIQRSGDAKLPEL
jgi:hypothetical protein